MNAYKNIVRNTSALLALMFVGNTVFAQEYDDLYFNGSDRKEIKYDGKTVTLSDESRSTYQSFANNTYTDKYSSHNVNPDYIARYQSGNTIRSYEEEAEENNSNFSQPSNSDATVEYYDENNEFAAENANGQTIINNYYGNTSVNPAWNNNNWNNWNRWNNMNRWNSWNRWGWNSWNDPFWGMNAGMFYDPWFGWGNSFNVSFGFGNRWGWGNPWNRWGVGIGFGNPWGWNRWGMNRWGAWDPWMVGFNSFYDPWFDPWMMGPGFGGWGWRNSYWNGYNHGLNNGLTFNDNARRVYRGARSNSRGGYVSNSPRSSSPRSTVEGLSRGRDNRDFSRTQNEYYSRSRTNVNSGRTVSSGRSATSSSARSSAATYNNSRSSRSDVSRGNSSRSSGRTYSNSSGSSSRSSGTTRRYNSSNNSSYSRSGARSSSPSYNNSRSRSSSGSSYRSNGGSSYRSSGSSSRGSYSSGSSRSSGRSYSPSRSSGSSSGRSSGSSSRSGRSGR